MRMTEEEIEILCILRAVDHEGCHRFGVRNKTDGWLQIHTTNLRTEEKAFFTVRSGDTVFLKGQPGPYMWDFVWWCGGEMETWHVPQAPLTSFWLIMFKCPAGYAGAIFKW